MVSLVLAEATGEHGGVSIAMAPCAANGARCAARRKGQRQLHSARSAARTAHRRHFVDGADQHPRG
jgi:hypothetical protein